MLILILLFSLTCPIWCRKEYPDYSLILLIPKEGDNFDSLRKLLDDNKVDVWGLPNNLYNQKSILIPPALMDQVESVLNSSNIDYEILTRNLQERIDKQYAENPPDNAAAGKSRNFPLDVYHTFEAISSHIDYLEFHYWPVASVETIGTTFEGNRLKILKVGFPSLVLEKPIIWIDSGIHAREWITPATSLYIIHQFLENKLTDPEIIKLLSIFDWYFLPVVNPDGYNYTWINDRLWRKNRAPSSSNSSCKGTDLNRNFGVAFGDSSGAKSDPCGEKYHGPAAFSEKETSAIRKKILELGSNLKAVVSLHNYGQLLMSPYGYTKDYPPDYNDQMKALNVMKSAIKKTHGSEYTAGRIAEIEYFASGNSVDWVYEEGKVKHSITIEVADLGREGYLLSKAHIISTAQEIFTASKALAKYVSKKDT